MTEIIKKEMTSREIADMKKLSAAMSFKEEFEHGYQMGFMAGKLSALTDILNNSKLYNGSIATNVGDEIGLTAGVPGAVAQPRKKGSSRSGDGNGKDKASH